MRTRVISALVAVFVLFGTYAIWRTQGLFVVSALLAMVCMFEYSRLTLGLLQAPLHLRITFLFLCAALMGLSSQYESLSLSMFVSVAVIYVVMVLMTIQKTDDLQDAIKIQNAGVMGFVYVGIFPSLILRLLSFERGDIWLLGLLAIVFAGDTTAYLVGSRFGKNKLLEAVSPKKTFEGAFGGLLGSGLIGALMGHYFVPQCPLNSMILLALATGAFAQAGDFFESLLKRVADVKDSGKIMPGHGGMLDRLDGVLFAAPIYYILARSLL